MQKLGARQQAVYDYIVDHSRRYSFPPTIREIGAAVGLNSPATVHAHVKALAKKGLISVNPSTQRTITVSDGSNEGANLRYVPLVGTVAAGQPIFAFDNNSESIPLPASFLHGAGEGDVFLLNIKGNSMIEAGMFDGDMIAVHRALSIENGDIAAVRVNGDTATVKRVFYEKDKIRLQPENSSMEPIYASYDSVEMIGKVVALLRKY